MLFIEFYLFILFLFLAVMILKLDSGLFFLFFSELIWITIYWLVFSFSFFFNDTTIFFLVFFILVFSVIEIVVGVLFFFFFKYFELEIFSFNFFKSYNFFFLKKYCSDLYLYKFFY